MNFLRYFYLASICFAIYIPSTKLSDATLDVASNDVNIQKQLREAVQNKSWPMNPLAKPKGMSQLKWSQSILNEFSPDLTYVWSPPILWETFLACLQFERHDISISVKDSYFDRNDKLWHDSDGSLQDNLIEKFSSIIAGKTSKEEAMLSIEKDFLAFLGTAKSFHDDPLWYSGKVRDLLKRIEIAFKKLDGDCYRSEFKSLCDLWNAFSDDIKRLKKGEKLMLELMAELEHKAVINDDYLIVRVTNGYRYYESDGPNVPRALDWTRKLPGQNSPYVYEVSHHDYYEDSEVIKLIPKSAGEDFTDHRTVKFSYGYTLLGGGWQEASMPSGACCLAYASYEEGNPITYVVRIAADEVERIKLFMVLPKIPLQLAYFGYGEFFHPRLGATHDDKMLIEYRNHEKIPEELKLSMANPLLFKESLKLLKIDSDDYVTAFNAAHDMINRYLAEHSRIIGINHRLIIDENDAEALRILKYQKKLSEIHRLEQKVQTLENISKTTIYKPYMSSNDYPKAVSARIQAITKKLDNYDSVFEKLDYLLKDQKTAAEICLNLSQRNIAGYELMTVIRRRMPEKIKTEGSNICFNAKIDCEGLGIDPLIMYLMKGKWPRILHAKEYNEIEDIRRFVESYKKFRALVDAGTFNVAQLG